MKKKAVAFMLSLSFLLIGCSVQDSHDTIVSGSNNSVGNETNKTAGGAVVDVPVDVGVTVSSDEYNELKNKINQLESQNAELQKQVEVAQSQLQNIPIINYANIGLQINGDEIPVNSSNSMITVDEKQYLSRDFLNGILGENEQITIKDDKLYIGKIVKEKANVFDKKDQWIISNDRVGFGNDTDSYNNINSNAFIFSCSKSNIILNLDNNYAYIKFDVATSKNINGDNMEQIIVKADDNVVYTSESFNYLSKPFSVDGIFIDNCSLLTIECNVSDFGRGNQTAILSNVVVYNE